MYPYALYETYIYRNQEADAALQAGQDVLGELDGLMAKVQQAMSKTHPGDLEGLDKELSAMRGRLDSMSLPYVVKGRVRGQLDQAGKDVFQERSRRGKEAAEQAIAELLAGVQGGQKAVYVLPRGVGGGAAVKKIIESIKKKTRDQQAFLCLSSEDVAGADREVKVSVFAYVPDSLLAGGLSASDWVQAAMLGVGGKGGGKGGSAQGSVVLTGLEADKDLQKVIVGAQRY